MDSRNPEGILRCPMEFKNITRAIPEGNFQIPEGIFKFTRAREFILQIHDKKPNLLQIFFNLCHNRNFFTGILYEICVRNSVFWREFAYKFPKPGENFQISEGIFKFTITRGKVIYYANSRQKTEFIANILQLPYVCASSGLYIYM